MQLEMETNFYGPIRVWQAALPLMPKNGATRLAPLAGEIGVPGWQGECTLSPLAGQIGALLAG